MTEIRKKVAVTLNLFQGLLDMENCPAFSSMVQSYI